MAITAVGSNILAMNRKKLTITLVAVFVVLAVVNLAFGGRGDGGEPLKGAAELAQLPDPQLEGAVLAELGRQIYGEGARPDAWRKLRTPALHLWSVAQPPRDIGELGLGQWLKDHAGEASSPGPADLADGLAGMGLTEAAHVAAEIRDAAASPPDQAGLGRLQARLAKALFSDQAKAQRLAWVKANLKDILGR